MSTNQRHFWADNICSLLLDLGYRHSYMVTSQLFDHPLFGFAATSLLGFCWFPAKINSKRSGQAHELAWLAEMKVLVQGTWCMCMHSLSERTHRVVVNMLNSEKQIRTLCSLYFQFIFIIDHIALFCCLGCYAYFVMSSLFVNSRFIWLLDPLHYLLNH